jgi:hypothetical protein
VQRVLLIILPPISFQVTKRICLGLQHHDESLLHHGIETGIIRRLPSGAYVEVEVPLPAKKAEVLAAQIGYQHHDDSHALPSGNGHAPAGDGHRPPSQQRSTDTGEIKRPVGVLAKARGRLENFFDEPRETVPDTQPHPED